MIHRFGLFKTMVDAVPDLTIVADAMAILNFVHQRYPTRPVYVYGHSLGGAVAIDICQKVPVRGLIVENTYTSIQDMVQAMYPRYTPYPFIAKLFLWNHWKSDKKISKVQAPILFLSADKDEIVPSSQMQKLYTLATHSTYRKFVRFPRSTHMDIFTAESTAFKSSLREFIDNTMK
ncbi:Alpha/beta hydrolase domain-containing protein 13 [Apophysomyces ossiformis]|uniref:Alpha/beta hydrolase domain-containing protein 13 n=1 Tax=Apophysomyces ossiformis TaxID=679940 RepID=A0A8H7ERB9_9FUNG|nr:Alpha/beta hydrolase domain-containing protein 13 [Apophysomyces ossiformis]